MNIKDILNNEVFKSKVSSGEISPVFVREMKQGCFTLELVQRLVFSKREELSTFDIEMLNGTMIFEPEPIKINIVKFKKQLVDFLVSIGLNTKVASLVSKNLASIYKKASKITGVEFETESLTLSVCSLCFFNNDDPTIDIKEVNSEAFGWCKPGFVLFAWSEDDGAFYMNISDENNGSIWWLNHEEEKLKLISLSSEEFVGLILKSKRND